MNSTKNIKNLNNLKVGILSLCLMTIMTLVNINSYGITVTSTITNTCSGTSNGAINLTVTNGTAPYTFIWSNGATDQNLSGLSMGLYGVTVTDAIGQTASANEFVGNFPFMVPVITGGPTGCNSLDLDAGAGYVSYLWSDGGTNQVNTINVIGDFNLTVTVTDAFGCMGTASSTGTVFQSPTISCTSDITVSNQIDLCGAVVAYMPPTATGLPIPAVGFSHQGIFFDGGVTNVIATASNLCGVATCSFNVTVEDNEAPIAIGHPITVTLDNSGNTSIQGSDVDGGSFDNCGIASMTVSPNTFTCNDMGNSIPVTLTVTDADGNSTSCTSMVQVIDNIYPVAITSPATITLDNNGMANISASDIDGGSFDNCSIFSMEVIPSYFNCTNIGDNTVTLMVEDFSGNISMSTTTVTVVGGFNPTLSTISGNTSACQGSFVTYSIDPVLDATNYNWTMIDGTVITTPVNTVSFIMGNTSGTLSVTASNDCGTSQPSTLAITSIQSIGQPSAISGAASVCFMTSQTYSIPQVSGATSYTWELPLGWMGSSSSETINVTAGINGGSIRVYANSGCGTSLPSILNVSVGSLPGTPGSILGNTHLCTGTTQTYSIASVAGATSYIWALPVGWTGSSTSTSITVTAGNNSGNITVASVNDCGISNITSVLGVNVKQTPAQPSVINGNTTVCNGTLQTYSVPQVSGATSYGWTLPSQWISTQSANTVNALVRNSNNNDNVTITVTASNNCGTSQPASLGVTSNSVMPVNISGTPGNFNYCSQVSPTSVTLIASPGFSSYAWSPSGGNSQSAVISSVNNYTVTAVNSNGCVVTATKAVTNNCGLACGLTTNSITGTSAHASWFQSQCGYNYCIRISVHNQNNWSTYTVSPVGGYTFSGLSLSTQYDWQIKTNCNTSGTINSGWSPIQTFTTLAQRMEEEAVTTTSLNIYPNPATSQVNIKFSTMEEGNYSINLMDMTGRMVKSELDNASLGENSHILNLDGISKGLYFVTIQKGQTMLKSKLVVE